MGGTPVEEHATRVAHVEAPKTCENMKNTRIFCHSSFTQAIFGRCPCSPLSAGPFQRSSGQIHLSHQSQQLGGDPRKEGLQGVRALKDFPKPQSPSRSIKQASTGFEGSYRCSSGFPGALKADWSFSGWTMAVEFHCMKAQSLIGTLLFWTGRFFVVSDREL